MTTSRSSTYRCTHWLCLVLMVLVAARPLLLLACAAHEQQHLGSAGGAHEHLHDVLQDLIQPVGETPIDPHSVAHLHVCCGQGHACPAATPAAANTTPLAADIPLATAAAGRLDWTGLSPFRPPIVA